MVQQVAILFESSAANRAFELSLLHFGSLSRCYSIRVRSRSMRFESPLGIEDLLADKAFDLFSILNS
jgi:hypothetical protein